MFRTCHHIAINHRLLGLSIIVQIKSIGLHNTLKINVYHIHGVEEKWIEHYLYDRKQFVRIFDFSSSPLGISCGVPQCSVLGPRLVIIHKMCVICR